MPAYSYGADPDFPNNQNGTWNNETGYGRVNALAALQYLASNCTIPVITAPTIVQPGCPTPTTGTITVNATGTGTLEYSINEGASYQDSKVFTNLAPGTYNVYVRTKGTPQGCFAVYSGNPVIINPANSVVSTLNYTGAAVAIPDNVVAGVNIPLTLSGGGTIITDVNFKLEAGTGGSCDNTTGNTNASVTHSWNGDLIFKLISPSGTIVTLINKRGGSGNNFCTVNIDDNATNATSIMTSGGAIAGSFKPESLLSAFNGQNPNGNWILNVSDNESGDAGFLRRFSLVIISNAPCTTTCIPPVITAPQLTQPTCLVPTGRIIVKATGASTMEYSINNGTTYKTGATFANLAPGNNYRIKVRFQSTPSCVSTYTNNPIIINPPPPAPMWYLDADGDGYYSSSQSACSSPGIGWTSTSPVGGGGDCNDDAANGGAAINPGATELCNGKDDNCNGLTDDGLVCSGPTVTAPQVTQPTCLTPTGRIIVRATGTEAMQYSIDNGATFKNTASFPGLAPGNYNVVVRYTSTPANKVPWAGNPIVINPPPVTTWYLDADGDGYYSSSQNACSSPGIGWTSNPPAGGGGDCNDDPANGGAAINPGATEVCNGKDDNCNGLTDDGLVCSGPTVTAPQVTQPTCLTPTGRIIVRATGTEAMQYSIDNGATFKNTASFPGLAPGNYNVVVRYTSTPANKVPWAGNPIVINPPPVTTWYLDADGDGYYSSSQNACSSPGAGWTSNPPVGGGGDCNDNPANDGASINPGAIEICNGKDDNCNGLVDDGTIVLVAPTSIAGPVGVCRSATNQVFSVTPVPGATSYLWTLPSGATGSSTTSSISLSVNSTYITGNICVRAVNACGQSAQFCRAILYYGAKPATPGIISGTTIGLCNNENFSVVPVANTTNYNWVAPANTSIVSGQGTSQIVLAFGSGFVSGNLSVTAANCKGTSAARTLALAKNPAAPASITGPVLEVCEGSTRNYSCPAVTGATIYTWAVPSGAVINSGQGTRNISVTFPASFLSGTIRVAAGTNCGSGAQQSINVTGKPAFPSPISGPVSVCPSATGLQYSTPAVAGVTYNWTVPNGATITAGQGTAAITVNWGTVAGQIRVAGSNACGSSAYRSLSVSLLSCPAAITMAKSEEVAGEALKVSLWPNPARDVLMVTLDEFVPNQKMEMVLMTTEGRSLKAESLVPAVKGHQVRFDVRSYAAGIYLLHIKQGMLTETKKVMIVR